MKKIPLLTVSISNNSVSGEFRLSYRQEFLQVLETIPEGVTVSQMSNLLQIVKKFNDVEGDFLYLTDSEWTTLRDRLASAKFTIVAPEIVAMVEAVQNAKDENFEVSR